MERESELERLTELGITELQQGGFSPDMKISFLDVFDDMVLTGIDDQNLNTALHSIYWAYPSLRPLLDKHIESVARIAAEQELKK